MLNPHFFRIRARVIIGACLVLLILLALFQSLPLNHALDDDLQIEQMSASQAWIAERVAKDVQELEGTSTFLQVQAISELQNMLPAFESQQMALAREPTLPDIQPLLLDSQSDFVSMDMAAKALLAKLDQPVDPLEVQVILLHERTYFLDMAQITVLIEQEGEGDKQQFFNIELGFILLLMGLKIWHLIETERQMRDILKRFRAIHGVVKK